ncbi:MAG TPA: hypothetical protein VIG24_14030 [Acidimicrobiia bacterium]
MLTACKPSSIQHEWQSAIVNEPPHNNLENLKTSQLEMAFRVLASSEPQSPPEPLKHLTYEDWLCLQSLWETLQWQREHSRLH